MDRRAKPAEGSWTEHYPDLGTGLLSYHDSISPEFSEIEREAVFRRAWLNVGRVEELPREGAYFTKDLAVLKTSLLITRGADGEVRAFHNFCRHRGTKLAWEVTPKEETSGFCRQFVCKYHGWRYGLDGELLFALDEEEFFDFDKADFPLVSVHCDVWEGFIFVNLSPEPRRTLREFLGPMVRGLEGYPFHLLTERYGFRSEIEANWKIYLDAFQEYYHAPVLHSQQQVPSLRNPEVGYRVPHFQADGPHRLVETGGFRGTPRWQLPAEHLYPMERIARSGLMGPWDPIDIPELMPANLPPGVNPGGLDPWSVSNFQIFPNFVILVYERGWILTYHYWPTGPNTHSFEMDYYFPQSRSVGERIRHEASITYSKEAALQDAGTLDGTQRGLESGFTDLFPVCDQEFAVRHLHKVVGDWVDEYLREQKEAER